VSDYFSGVTVVFEKDVHEADIEHRLNAIRLIRGVLSVTPIKSDPNTYIAEERVRDRLWTKIRDVFRSERE
jgi:hypothetical protein